MVFEIRIFSRPGAAYGRRGPGTNPKQDYETNPIRPLFSTKSQIESQIPATGGGAGAPRAPLVYRQWGMLDKTQQCYTMQRKIEKRLLVAGVGLTAGQTPAAT